MTDREVQAISQFLLKFGYLGCYQITVCRRNVEKLSRDQIGQAVLDIREAWKREGLDVERLYKVAVLAHQYRADQDECLPGCCGPWGEIEPVMPPGPGADGQSALSGQNARRSYSPTVERTHRRRGVANGGRRGLARERFRLAVKT
jgi:hypothetical protein